MSGYVDSVVATRARAAGVTDVLRKPLQGREIAEALARALRIPAPKAATVE
jgi:FixJ family two-component response regulator